MSRVGNAPIKVPGNVELKVVGTEIVVKGSQGELKAPLPAGIILEQNDGEVQLKRENESRETRAMHGTARSLLNNCIHGVSEGWKKRLELVGVGYRAQMKGKELVLSLGYSHDIHFKMPDSVKAAVTDQTKIDLESIDKQKLGQVAAEIRSFRPPEPYKAKGVRYENEHIRRKAGKAGKAGKK